MTNAGPTENVVEVDVQCRCGCSASFSHWSPTNAAQFQENFWRDHKECRELFVNGGAANLMAALGPSVAKAVAEHEHTDECRPRAIGVIPTCRVCTTPVMPVPDPDSTSPKWKHIGDGVLHDHEAEFDIGSTINRAMNDMMSREGGEG